MPAPGKTPSERCNSDLGSDRPGSAGRSGWSLLLAAAVAGGLLYLALRGVDWRRVWQVIVRADFAYLAWVWAVMSGAVFLRALRWRVVLAAGQRLGLGVVFGATAAGYLGNNFLPARAGEVVRSVMIGRQSSLSNTFVLTTALLERAMDAIALVLFGSLALLHLDSAPRWLADILRSAAALAALAAAALALLPRMEALATRVLLRVPLPPNWRARLSHAAAQGFLGLRAFHNLRRFAAFVLLTLLIWSMDALCVMAGGRALGMPISFPLAVLLIAGLGLGSALPSMPGYVGMYQFVCITVLGPFGFGRSEAMAYSLVAQAMAYAVVTFWGLIGLARYRGGGLTRLPWQRRRPAVAAP